ncbi:MAG: short-chain fatty acid transporter [Candidatus Marinimicrobia bacterium]|nr:short-chain fatty acid transporter [Candidatus Neomarinimicrobiota bacterium]
MLSRFTSGLVTLFDRWMPDALVVAFVLTAITFILGIGLTETGPIEAISIWGDNLWNLLEFTNQVILVILLGYALAQTEAMQRLLRAAAGLVTTPSGAYITVTAVSLLSSFFGSGGFGLVAGAIIARTVGIVAHERNIPVHYPLLVACAYSGFVIWHQGLSGAIPLAIATPGHFLEPLIGIVPSSQTLLTTWNAAIAGIIFLTLPLFMARLRPTDETCRPIPASSLEMDNKSNSLDAKEKNTPAARLENSRWLNLPIVAAGVIFLYIQVIERGTGLNLNIINFVFLILGIALSRSPLHYLNLIVGAARMAGPFLLQYPLYAGIAGLIADTGLARMVVDLFVQISTAETLPITSFFSGAILNLFIPSGGGQWAIQGPIAMQSALELGADVPLTAMAVAFGDQWTNLIHPFLAIPVLAITGMHARDIMGYCAVAFLFTGLIFLMALLILI